MYEWLKSSVTYKFKTASMSIHCSYKKENRDGCQVKFLCLYESKLVIEIGPYIINSHHEIIYIQHLDPSIFNIKHFPNFYL